MSDRLAYTAPSGLVGRAAQLQRAAELIGGLSSGHGHILLIEGEPGIGKTALMGEIAHRAAAQGARLALSVAEEFEQRSPFAAISGWLALTSLDPETSRIASLLHRANPAAADASAADVEFLVTEAMLAMVDRWCAAGPVVLAIDDLQWADRASLLVLHRQGVTAAQLPLLIVAACRGGAIDDDVARLIRSWRARRAELVTLGPIDEPAVALLIQQFTGKAPARGLLKIIAGAGGNPLYVAEYTKALVSNGRIDLAHELADVESPTAQPAMLPETLIDVVRHRLSTLSPAAREMIRCAAILGPRLSVAELSATLHIPAFEMLGVVHELIEAGVLVTDADRLAFGHDVTRQAVYESIPPSARQALHLEAARALAAVGATIERVAEHLLSAHVLDSEALAWTVATADRLIMRAPEMAVELLRQAVELPNPTDAQVGRLQLALATALLATRRFAQAKTLARQALAHETTRSDQSALRWIVVHALVNEGKVESALEEARDALDHGGLSAVESARFYGIAAQCMHVVSPEGPEAAKMAAREARDAGIASGDPQAAAYGLQAIVGAERWDGRFVDALKLADQAADHLTRAGSSFDAQLDPHLIRGNCLVELDRMKEAAEAYAEDLKLAEAGVGTFFLAFHHLSVARMHFLAGDWDDALTEIETARQAPDHLGLRQHLDGLATVIAVHRGDAAATARLKGSLDQPLISGSSRHTFDDRSWGRSLAVLAAGDETEAYNVLASAWSECAQGKREFCGHYLLPGLAALGLAHGHTAAAREAFATFNRYLSDRHGAAMHRSAAFAAAVLDADVERLLRVADDYAAAGRPLFEAGAREQAAELLAAGGDRAQARLHLDAALRRYAALEASWDLARASARLRRYGIRHGAYGQRRRPKTGWTALTPTEQKIAAFVSDGMSNPDIAARTFTSRRTVQFHVSNILTKLDLTSRVELAALVVRQAR